MTDLRAALEASAQGRGPGLFGLVTDGGEVVLPARSGWPGTGKPERLSGDLSGFWSRRTDQEHRLVYTVHGDQPVLVQARYHY